VWHSRPRLWNFAAQRALEELKRNAPKTTPEALNHIGTAPKPLPFTAIPCAKLRSTARMELSLKPSHAKVKDYYSALNQFGQLNISHEIAA
jgi:hypothetical protein